MAHGLAVGPVTTPMYTGFGVETPFGVILPPGGKIAAYVRSTGVQDQDPEEIANAVVPTLAQALPYVRSGKGDTIVCLPGHTENVTTGTALTGLKAGTRIIGMGHGSNR